MKKLTALLLTITISLMVLMPLLPKVQAYGILADEIAGVSSAVNWSNLDWRVQHTGVILGRVSMPQYRGHEGAWGISDQARALRMAEIDGFSFSPSEVLSSQSMLSYVPNNYLSAWYLNYQRFYLSCYRYAQGTAYASKWSPSGAIDDIWGLVGNNYGRLALAYDPSSGQVYIQSHRYYDETAETMDFFTQLGDLDKAKAIWDYTQGAFWNGAYYGYSGTTGYECEAGPFALLVGKLYSYNGLQLMNFDRVQQDLANKFLDNGWSSPLWGAYHVCTHAGDSRLRLQNTAAAWMAMMTYFTRFSSTAKQNMQNMLTGSGGTKAWQYLLQSELHDASSNRFRCMVRDSSGTELSDYATAIALKLMILMGIVPVTGGLAIPLLDESYEETEFPMPASHFHFDYSGHTLTIPCQVGSMKFQFGSSLSNEVTFSTQGIYKVTFSSDWNTASTSKLGDLGNYPYLTKAFGGGQPPVPTGSIFVTGKCFEQPVTCTAIVSNNTWSSSNTTVPPTGNEFSNLQPGLYNVVGSYYVNATYSVNKYFVGALVESNEAYPVSFNFTYGGATQYACPTCGELFNTQAELDAHIRAVHGRNWWDQFLQWLQSLMPGVDGRIVFGVGGAVAVGGVVAFAYSKGMLGPKLPIGRRSRPRSARLRKKGRS